MQNSFDKPLEVKIHKSIKPDSVEIVSFKGERDSNEGKQFIKKNKALRIPIYFDNDSKYEDYRNLALSVPELIVSERLSNLDPNTLSNRQKKALKHIIVPQTFTMQVKDMSDFSILKIEMLSKNVEGHIFPPAIDDVTQDNFETNMQLLADMFDLLLQVGIDHFDTYDENIIVGNDGEIYLIDFDRARFDHNVNPMNIRQTYISYIKKYLGLLRDKYQQNGNKEELKRVAVLEKLVESKKEISNDNLNSCAQLYEEIFNPNPDEQ